MIEPTETESKETLDGFVAALREFVAARDATASGARCAGHDGRRRVDETRAARQPDLRWTPSPN